MTSGRDVIILALFYLGRLRRQDGEDGRGHPAPRQGPCWPLGTPALETLVISYRD